MGKRYMLFVFNRYYPAGGMDDCKLITDNYSEINKEMNDIKKEQSHDVIQVYNTEERKMICEYRLQEVLKGTNIVKKYINQKETD